MMLAMEALKRGFKQYATFSGRASRSEFWRFMVSRETEAAHEKVHVTWFVP